MRYLLLMVVLMQVFSASADEAAQQLYSKYQSVIYRVEVITPGMDKKASLGTGFLVGRGDVLASNFHVVSSVVHEPNRYRLEWVADDGSRGPLKVIAVDVVHDLSLLRAEKVLGEPLTTTTLPEQGTELYSLGHPLALDLAIVMGTANGLLEKSIYEKIHFSGSINPGMSGGPTLDAKGHVVGINVATAGNSVGFLVPAYYLDVLMQKSDYDADTQPGELEESIGNQLIANQDALMGELLSNEWPDQIVGQFRVPGEISYRLDCWGDEQPEENDRKIRQINTNCQGQDSIYLSERQSAGTISYQYFWLDSKSLPSRAFYQFYEQGHASHFMGGADETDVGNFICSTRFVDVAGQSFKANICARPYKRYPELNDFMVLMAMTGHDKEGFMFTLDLSTVTLENGMNLFEQFLEQFKWIQ